VLQSLSWQAFFFSNLIPVTIGNIIGGVVFVAIAYWTCYLRPLMPKEVSLGGKLQG
jgi:formate transporter